MRMRVCKKGSHPPLSAASGLAAGEETRENASMPDREPDLVASCSASPPFASRDSCAEKPFEIARRGDKVSHPNKLLSADNGIIRVLQET